MERNIEEEMEKLIKEIQDDFVEEIYDYRGLEIEINDNLIDDSDMSNKELTAMGNKCADYYLDNKNTVLEHIYQHIYQTGWYVEEYTKEEIFEKIGDPKIFLIDETTFNITFLNSTLDYDHIVTVEVDILEDGKYHLSYVTIDG